VQWGEFLKSLPGGAHLASTAPPAGRFGGRTDFQTQAATRFAVEGIGRGEKVLIIGSRWQYLDILRGVQHLMQDPGSSRSQMSWRNRDIAVFEANEVQSDLLEDNMLDGMRFACFIERACPDVGLSRHVRVWNNLGARFHESGHRRASRAMERLWHQARSHLGYTIMCSYPLSDSAPVAHLHDLGPSLDCHTHLIRPARRGITVERLRPRGEEGVLEPA